MALSIPVAQLKFDLDHSAAQPDYFVDQGNAAAKDTVTCHLTEGFDGQRVVRPAFRGSVTVPLSYGPADRAKDWTFGFIQLVTVSMASASYNGRIQSEGNAVVKWSIPPNLATRTLWDVSSLFAPPPLPWFLFPDNTAKLPMVKSSWVDHPWVTVPLRIKNSTLSNVDNYLYYLNQEANFYTIFTAQEPSGVLHFVSHLFWTLNYELTFVWSGGLAKVRKSDSFLDFHGGRMNNGPPVGKEIDALLKSLSTSGAVGMKDANNIMKESQIKSFSFRSPNHVESFGWIPGTLADFWL